MIFVRLSATPTVFDFYFRAPFSLEGFFDDPSMSSKDIYPTCIECDLI